MFFCVDCHSCAAYGYVNGIAQPLPDLDVMSPMGQMFSTANDMAKLMSFFFRDKVPANGGDQLLDGATVREMLTRRAHVDARRVHCTALLRRQKTRNRGVVSG